ncbi:NAD(P)/FAD-dependent oxidoreductase [Dichotomicrobium thermohalophilum]|uniref:Sulfide:quinone oxidoreductase n=1 Tax=Dichotomicrobium thermohalophilum TaxID=933063 RepID=A0A397Q5L3_9HYPH|nr:FAD/NAD(P)-binding oxidoreductase [Dichotomicrobium thermohalophilum]RIA55739.1 sulfide:quinone oxidoreductase [Dichotomicrobium thermohalophilum]
MTADDDDRLKRGAGPDRRQFIKLAAGAAGVAMLPGAGGEARAEPFKSRARFVITGAGAGGISAASRLSQMTEGARITIIDARENHYFQPGYTLVGSGVWTQDRVISSNAEYMPRDVEWIKSAVAEFDPDGNKVVTAEGQNVPYDFLIVATGCILDYPAIEGMEEGLIGREGISSIYASPEAAAASWQAMQRFVESGGTGLFTRPATEMKCAGAPLKYTFLTDDRLRRAGNRSKAELIYNAHNDETFSVPAVDSKVRELFAQRDISWNRSHVLRAIDPGQRIATFETPEGTTELGYDFIHVIPPMRTPEPVRNSPLPWREGPFAADGWIEVDKVTLQHRRYPNVFGVGDVNGVPKGKTAASVKWQVPVAVENMVAVAADKEMTATYNGYTSCPMVTRVGQAMLIEFDYENNLVPSFPFIDPLKPMWLSWVIEEQGLKPTYFAMLRGLA